MGALQHSQLHQGSRQCLGTVPSSGHRVTARRVTCWYQAWTLKGSGHFLSQNLPKNQGQNLGKPSRTIIKSSKIRSYLSFESLSTPMWHQETSLFGLLRWCQVACAKKLMDFSPMWADPDKSRIVIPGQWMVWRWSKWSKSSPSDYMIVTYWTYMFNPPEKYLMIIRWGQYPQINLEDAIYYGRWNILIWPGQVAHKLSQASCRSLRAMAGINIAGSLSDF